MSTFNPKIRFLGQKVCSVAPGQTDTHTRKWIQRKPFQGFRNFSFNLSSRIGPIKERDIVIQHHYLPTTGFKKGPLTLSTFQAVSIWNFNMLRPIRENPHISWHKFWEFYIPQADSRLTLWPNPPFFHINNQNISWHLEVWHQLVCGWALSYIYRVQSNFKFKIRITIL